ncbi:peptide/nickel transport system permease protein [uncultured Gammaproteobacteria bacterium]
MIRFLASRAVQAVLVLAVMSFIILALIGLMPGDPIDVMISANPRLNAADAERLRALHGLNLPLWQRYLNWLAALAGGDLGYSRLFGLPVTEVLGPRLLNTLELMGSAFILTFALALPIGVAAAQRPDSRLDAGLNLLCFAGISAPPFWVALLLIMLFSVTLGWLPAGGAGPPGHGGFLATLPYLVLPVATLVLAGLGGQVRYIRAAVREALAADHIRTARAKGLSERQVVWRHALPNALIPVVTILALDFGGLFSGALITETMFAWPGMGKLIYEAVMGNDYNLALVSLLLATATTLLGSFLADLAYAALDPRIGL